MAFVISDNAINEFLDRGSIGDPDIVGMYSSSSSSPSFIVFVVYFFYLGLPLTSPTSSAFFVHSCVPTLAHIAFKDKPSLLSIPPLLHTQKGYLPFQW